MQSGVKRTSPISTLTALTFSTRRVDRVSTLFVFYGLTDLEAPGPRPLALASPSPRVTVDLEAPC